MLIRYDKEKLQELLMSFNMLTDMRIAVLDTEFKVIAGDPKGNTDFCNIIHDNPAAIKNCSDSDAHACRKCGEFGEIYIYTCHTGLTETITPIFHNGVLIGYLMFGQILNCDNKDLYWNEICSRIENYRLDAAKLKDAYSRMSPVSLERINAAAKILEACAGYLWLQKYITLIEDTFLNQFDSYILNNLHKDLSAEALCRYFSVSRSKLYKSIKGYYGVSVERLIRSLRVKRAKELLVNTSDSLSEISSLVGYPDHNYFIKLFKTETGITPRQYRKRFHSIYLRL